MNRNSSSYLRPGATAFYFRASCEGLAVLLAGLLVATVPAAARTPEILAFGDSLTSGYGLLPDKSFPARLEAKLRAEGITARVINAGVAGDTTAGGLARLDNALA